MVTQQTLQTGLVRFMAGLLLLSVARVGLAVASPSGKPNVLFIAMDDLRPELGCYGVSYAQSPNLDRLAKQGVLFTNHFVQVPTCGASRYALLTGRSPAHSGVTRSNSGFYQGHSALAHAQTRGAQTMPELFRRNGYRTVCIGKISHTPDGKVFSDSGKGDGRPELPNAWDLLATPYGPWKRGWGIFFAYAGGRHREDGQGHKDLMEFMAEKDEDLPDGLMAKQAIEQLHELKQNKTPFFLGLGFFKPHLPFVATQADWNAVAQTDVPPPPHPEKVKSPYWHRSGEFYKYNFPFPKEHPLPPKDQLHVRRAYLAAARYTDRQVGKVLDALQRLGLADSTIVIVWGDHGWHLGDSGIWGKHTPFERAVHSPLIIRAPGISKNGLHCNAPVETIDIYPTLVDLCQPTFTTTEHPLNGTSLKPLLQGKYAHQRKAAISYWGRAISVRTSKYRLIATNQKGKFTKVELYNIEKCPDPVTNIASQHTTVVDRLLEYARSQIAP